MKLPEAIKKAHNEHNLKELSRIVNFLRFRLGWLNEKMCFEWCRLTGCNVQDFENLMFEVDTYDNEVTL